LSSATTLVLGSDVRASREEKGGVQSRAAERHVGGEKSKLILSFFIRSLSISSQARLAHKIAKDLPLPVGLSSSAFWEFFKL